MEEQVQQEFKAVKITQPLWIGQISGVIHDFCERIKIPGISYETLYSYFVQTSQFGGDRFEFWVIFSGNNPVAFAHWYVKPLPYHGVVSCDYVYSWNRMAEPLALLIDKFIEFGYKNNSVYYEGTATNEAVARVFTKAAVKKGINLKRTELINLFGRIG